LRLQPEVQRHLFSDCLQLPAAFPNARERLPHLLVADVQMALRRLDVGVSEHQLDDYQANHSHSTVYDLVFTGRPDDSEKKYTV
jgi:hypothetical protein